MMVWLTAAPGVLHSEYVGEFTVGAVIGRSTGVRRSRARISSGSTKADVPPLHRPSDLQTRPKHRPDGSKQRQRSVMSPVRRRYQLQLGPRMSGIGAMPPKGLRLTNDRLASGSKPSRP